MLLASSPRGSYKASNLRDSGSGMNSYLHSTASHGNLCDCEG